jgi:hypothetical protein
LAQQPKTVTDYFLALPASFYSKDSEGKTIKGAALARFRRSLIKTEDIKNGYLRLEGAWEGWAEIALFKKTDGSYLIAQAETSCGPACDGFVKFFTYNAGKWTDVTRQVFPTLSQAAVKKALAAKKISEPDNTPYYFRLPRIGTTVKMACNECETTDNAGAGGEDFTILEFAWNGAKFTQK